MTEKRVYFPVGTQLTAKQMRSFTLEQLQNREILDPRYAGFEKDFDWQKYISISIENAVFRERIERVLKQFSQTPEGQHVIRQAAAMQSFRMFGDKWKNVQARVPISEPSTQEKLEFGSSYFLSPPRLVLSKKRIEQSKFLGVNGQPYDPSLQGVIFHELLHAADSLFTNSNMVIFSEVFSPPISHIDQLSEINNGIKKSRIESEAKWLEEYAAMANVWRKEYINPVIEHPVIKKTNTFAWDYYKEPIRALNIDALEIALNTGIRPELGSDHYYDSITLPSTPFRPTKPERGGR